MEGTIVFPGGQSETETGATRNRPALVKRLLLPRDAIFRHSLQLIHISEKFQNLHITCLESSQIRPTEIRNFFTIRSKKG